VGPEDVALLPLAEPLVPAVEVEDPLEVPLVESPVTEVEVMIGAPGAVELVEPEVPSPVVGLEVEVSVTAAFGARTGFAVRLEAAGLAAATGTSGGGSLSAERSTGAAGTATLSAAAACCAATA
jgi:hypothetical protein